MWLPRDERNLLAFYAGQVEGPNGSYRENNEKLVERLSLASVDSLKEIKRRLLDKGLISFTYLDKHQVEPLNVQGKKVPKEAEPNVTVTPKGFYLGVNYHSWFGTFGVWCKEYGWLWAFVAAIASILGVIVGMMALRQ